MSIRIRAATDPLCLEALFEMALIVQKYGGTSVEDAERIRAAAARVVKTERAGNQVVVVVSARGKTTDELIALATEIDKNPDPREMDMLISTGEQVSCALVAMAIHALGRPAISFTGGQVGIVTDGSFQRARIVEVKPDRIREALGQGRIVIVAGFQGVDSNSEITTLDRGGSNLTAVALAAALKAEVCEMYTDVEGVFTADPRVVPAARKLAYISYDEMLELASSGAGVLQARSVELAKKFDVPIRVRPAYNESEGTLVCMEAADMEGVFVRGAALNRRQAKLAIDGVPDRTGQLAAIFDGMARARINVDMIVHTSRGEGMSDISFTVDRSDLDRALQVAQGLAREIGAGHVYADSAIASVSVVGIGMRSHYGVAATMFQALASRGINVNMVTTSEIKISCVVAEEDGEEALRALHEAFELDKSERDARQET